MNAERERAISGSCLGGIGGATLGMLMGGFIGWLLGSAGDKANTSPLHGYLFDGCGAMLGLLLGIPIGGVIGAIGGAVFGTKKAMDSRPARDDTGEVPGDPQEEGEIARE